VNNGGKRSEVKKVSEDVYGIIALDNKVIIKHCSMYEAFRNKGLKIKDADLLTAASAKANNLILITSDKELRKLERHGLEIRFINFMEIK